MTKASKSKEKKLKKVSDGLGCISIHAGINNTILSVTKSNGEVLAQTSTGAYFRGAKKTTIYAAQKAAQTIMNKAKEFGIDKLLLKVKDIGPGRDAALREIINNESFRVEQLIDNTGISFGSQRGVRPRKRPRK